MKVIKTYSIDPELYQRVKAIASNNAQTISGIISNHFENIVKKAKK